MILEFGSVTFLLVSMLMAYANFRIRKQTDSSLWLTVMAMIGLLMGTLLILYYELTTQPEQLVFILSLYGVLTLGASYFALRKRQL
jgi:drug/metabolite transporter (DMT)-like permease